MTRVLAIADHAQRQARFSTALATAFSAVGLDLHMSTQRQLVDEVSIEQAIGQPPIVHPDRPLLWLSPGDAGARTTRDERFVSAESYAAARAIALLSGSPVLNRPSAVSMCGTFPPGAPVAVRRARRLDVDAVVRPERFTGTWLTPEDAEDVATEVHDYATGRRSFGRRPDAVGPFRCRPAVPGADLVKVRVVGDRTITRSAVGPDDLTASRRMASGYGLDLATVWWMISRDDGTRTLARIDCWAYDAGFDTASDEVEQVAEAVAAWMTERLTSSVEIRR
jgi:hypothetical protein